MDYKDKDKPTKWRITMGLHVLGARCIVVDQDSLMYNAMIVADDVTIGTHEVRHQVL